MLPFRTVSANRTGEPADFKPVRVIEIELSKPLPAMSAQDEAMGQVYGRVLALVRLHSQPLDVVDLLFDGKEELSAAEVARRIWSSLDRQIASHLEQDGLAPVEFLGEGGLPVNDTPNCIRAREESLTNAPFASVVVATHNRPATLAVTLESLLALDYPNYEIIVVDNAPNSSAAADIVAGLNHRGGPRSVRYLREDRAGTGRAHNRALQEVGGSIVAFSDDDVMVDRNWLTELVRGFDVGDRVGCVTGLVVPAELNTFAQVLFEQYGGFMRGFQQRIFDLRDNRQRNPFFPVAAGWFGTGASMSYRTSVLREMQGFDVGLGPGTRALGAVDQEAFFEVIWRGYQLVYQPSSVMHHFHRRDYASLRRQVRAYGVGLTAYLTSVLLQWPGLFLYLAVRTPWALRYLLTGGAHKKPKTLARYPLDLAVLERVARLYGPLAYLRSRWEMHHRPPDLGPAVTPG